MCANNPLAVTCRQVKKQVGKTKIGEHPPLRDEVLQMNDVFFFKKRILSC
jgi:hypothetical protein